MYPQGVRRIRSAPAPWRLRDISSFSNRRIGGKDSSSAAGDFVRGSLYFSSSFERAQKRHLVGVFQLAADRNAVSQPRHTDADRTQEP